jgi:hypothetical protein
MADVKISQLPVATAVSATDVGPIVHAGITVKATGAQVVTAALNATPVTIAQGGTNATTASGARTNLGLGTLATQDANNVNITGGAISGTTVAGYVPTTRTLTASTGLSGGGDLSADRSFAIANTGVTAATYGSATKIPVIAVNAQGQITNASEQTLSIASLGLSYGSFLQNGDTTLTNTINNNSAAPIVVGDTTDFGSSGYCIIENEIIQYVGKSATQLGTTSVTRGVKGTTNVSHTAGVRVTEAAANASGTSSAAIGYDTTVYSDGVTIANGSQITFAKAGLYNIQFSLQLLNYTTSDDNVTVWFKLNGNDIDQSASVEQVNGKHANGPGARILALNNFVQVTAGQYVELYWSTNSGNTVLASYPQGTNPTHPTSPAVILTAQQVA